MQIISLVRIDHSDHGTFGVLMLNGNFCCFSAELPWRDNRRDVSCIPPGAYLCQWINSPRHGECYTLREVHARDYVRIHVGNRVGDTSKGLLSDSQGCPMLGDRLGMLGSQKAVLSSGAAVQRFCKFMAQRDFMLDIRWASTP